MERKHIQQLVNQDNQTDQQSEQYLNECLNYIQAHLMAFYTQYADDTGLSLSQVHRKVSKWDRQQFRQALSEMDISDWPEEATDRLGYYTGNFKDVDKRHMMAAIVALGIVRLTVKNQRTIKKRVTDDSTNQISYLKTHMGLSNRQAQRVKRAVSVITEPKNVETWSDRLWLDSDTLAGDVQTLVNKHVRHGMNLNDIGELLAPHMNPKQFKPNKSVADRVKQMDYIAQRIVRTESARVVDEANMTTYKMLGIDSVDWIAEPSACTTGVNCAAIAAGSPYSVDEVPRIPADTHPQCRCSKIPHEGGILALQAAGSVVTINVAKSIDEHEDNLGVAVNESRAVDKTPNNVLPHAENAALPIEKFTRYALDPTAINSGGADKARVFKSALGITKKDSEWLRREIMKKLPESEAISHGRRPDGGISYEVNVMITGKNGKTKPVLTGWISDESGTRLTTLRVNTKLDKKMRGGKS
ncbi:hypothetical protein EFR94_09630 [Levilactobacillus brevis]|uniref:DUF6883 domain-containing protein n=1 Tax=Levilactobacillus brevis TaxID=1580 RepID=UPI0021A3F917|nr:DUF6883 domain-containing protein [Levilactobacillus brevis]MCT3567645.1 hypothetical protein [Levilactobacillus brevis]